MASPNQSTTIITVLKFHDKIVEFLKPLRELKYFDVKLQSKEGEILEGHRIILALHSRYLDRLFTESNRSTIELDIGSECMGLLMQFLYNGSVSVNQIQLNKLVEVLDEYCIQNWEETNEEISIEYNSLPRSLGDPISHSTAIGFSIEGEENGSDDGQRVANVSVEDSNDETATSADEIVEHLIKLSNGDQDSIKLSSYSLQFWVGIILYRNRDETTDRALQDRFKIPKSTIRDNFGKDPITANYSVCRKSCAPTSAGEIVDVLSRPDQSISIDENSYALRYWCAILLKKLKGMNKSADAVSQMTGIAKQQIYRIDSNVTPASEGFIAVRDHRKKRTARGRVQQN